MIKYLILSCIIYFGYKYVFRAPKLNQSNPQAEEYVDYEEVED